MEKYLNAGDPQLKTWFLVRQNYLPFILCGLYALFSIVIGPAIMKNRKPFKLNNVMIVFNFFLVVSYAVAIILYIWYLPQAESSDICRKFALKKGEINYKIACVCWWIYMLKYIELFDTVFFILRKKENLVTFLHIFHHFSVPIIGWILFRTEVNGINTIPAFLNAFVHTIMYTYYGLAAMGPKFKKYLWWKKHLTQLQMIQFVFFVVFETVLVPLFGCRVVQSTYVMILIFPPFFFYLFYQYYKSAFLAKSSPSLNGVTEKKSATNGGAVKNGVKYRTGEAIGRSKGE